MHESQRETGLRLVEAGSRGSSILAGIVMVAMFGSAAAAFESLIPFGSDPSQLTASSLAALPTTTAIPESRTKDNLVVEDDISPTTLPYPPYQTVRYACTQSGSAEKIKILTQKCQPGFAYVISESKTGVMVTPRRFPGDASTLCPSSALGSATCSNKSKPILSCATGTPAPCHVGYCVTVPPTPATPTGQKCESAGEVAPGGELAISDRRVAGLTEVLKNENTESRTEILNSTAGLSAPEQDALSRALTGSGLADAPQEIQSGRDVVAARIKALATCPYGVCDAEKVALADRDAELARQQKFIQDLRAMGGAQGLSPDDRTGTKLSEPTYVPDAVAGDTTFGGSTMPPPNKLPLNPEQASNKSNGSFTEAVTGVLGKGFSAVGSAVSNLAEKVKEAYKSTVSGVGELFKGPQFTQNTDPTPSGITEGTKVSSSEGNGTVPFKGPQFTSNSDPTPSGIVGPNRLTDEELARLPESVRDDAQRQCEIGYCPYMHRIAANDLSDSEKTRQIVSTALITAPECSTKSILDCFKAARLDYTKEGRIQLAADLGLSCGKIGDTQPNICMGKVVKQISNTGTVTDVGHVTIIDSQGNILAENVGDPVVLRSEEITSGPLSVAQGEKGRASLDALFANIEKGTDQTVYQVAPTIECIDTRGNPVPGAGCGAVYEDAVDTSAYLRGASISDVVDQIKSENLGTKYVVRDVNTTEYGIKSLNRDIAQTEGGLKALSVPFEDLPRSVQGNVLANRAASERASMVDQDTSAPTPIPTAGPIESSNLAPLYDQARVDKATTDRLNGLADEASRNEVIRTTDSVLAQVKTARMEEKQATIEADTTSGLAAYAALQAEQRARADKATSERLYGQANSYVLKNIDAKLVTLQALPSSLATEASDYKNQLASDIQNINFTQADIYTYLSEADKKLSDDITTRQIARGNEAYAARVAGLGMDTYIRQNPTVTGIEHAMLVAGQSDSQISTYVDTLASDGRKNSKTAAEADAYLNYNYQSVLKYTDQQIADGQSTLGLPAPSRASGSGVQVASLQTSGVIGLNADEVDAHIKGTFERARANVQEQINAAGGYLDLGKTVGIGTEVQAFQDDLKRQLAVIDKNYADYTAGKPSPALQQVITRLGQGDVGGGAGWGTLAGVKQGTDSDRAEFEKALEANKENGLTSIALGTAWVTGQVVGGVADGTKNLLGRFSGLSTFKPDVQTQLLDAVDPYGVSMRTLGDVVGVASIIPAGDVARAVVSGGTRVGSEMFGAGKLLLSDPYAAKFTTGLSRGASSISTRIEPPRLLQPSPVQPIRPPVPLPVVTSPRSISVVPPRTVPMDSSPASSVYFDARPGVMRWRNAETGQFASAPAPEIDFSRVRINPMSSSVDPNISRTDAVTRLLNDIRINNSTVPPVVNDNAARIDAVTDWLRSLTQQPNAFTPAQ